jgi:hypothetical protein
MNVSGVHRMTNQRDVLQTILLNKASHIVGHTAVVMAVVVRRVTVVAKVLTLNDKPEQIWGRVPVYQSITTSFQPAREYPLSGILVGRPMECGEA